MSIIPAELKYSKSHEPAQVNEAPYEAWLIKVNNVSEKEELLDAEGYEAVVAAEEA